MSNPRNETQLLLFSRGRVVQELAQKKSTKNIKICVWSDTRVRGVLHELFGAVAVNELSKKVQSETTRSTRWKDHAQAVTAEEFFFKDIGWCICLWAQSPKHSQGNPEITRVEIARSCRGKTKTRGICHLQNTDDAMWRKDSAYRAT